MQKIGLNVADKLLAGALNLMLEANGYQVFASAEDCELIITDSEKFAPDNCSVLYIGREVRVDENYLRRPFGVDELLQTLKVLAGEEFGQEKQPYGIKIDKKHKKATYCGEKLPLTEKELLLLALLYENKGRAVSDAEIIERVWQNETMAGSNIAAVYVNYLRKKLSEKSVDGVIARVRGKGYMYKERD